MGEPRLLLRPEEPPYLTYRRATGSVSNVWQGLAENRRFESAGGWLRSWVSHRNALCIRKLALHGNAGKGSLSRARIPKTVLG